jgi:hypothetical protein
MRTTCSQMVEFHHLMALNPDISPNRELKPCHWNWSVGMSRGKKILDEVLLLYFNRLTDTIEPYSAHKIFKLLASVEKYQSSVINKSDESCDKQLKYSRYSRFSLEWSVITNRVLHQNLSRLKS